MKDHEGCNGDSTRQEGMYLYMTFGSEASISVALSKLDAGVWHQRLRHMSEKGMKIMLSKDKMSGLKCIDLNFCEECVYGKHKKVSFSKVRKTVKAKKMELVHIDIWD